MNATVDAEGGFTIAAFTIDGSLEGKGRWMYRGLSAKWSSICDELLRTEGVNFNYTWSGPLSHIRTRLTSVRGAALLTIYVNAHTNIMSLLLRGHNDARMWISSLEKLHLVQGCHYAIRTLCGNLVAV